MLKDLTMTASKASMTHDQDPIHSNPIKFRMKNVPTEFLADSIYVQQCIVWINETLEVRHAHESIDIQYGKLSNIIICEMKKFFEILDRTKVSKKIFHHSSKQWWDPACIEQGSLV